MKEFRISLDEASGKFRVVELLQAMVDLGQIPATDYVSQKGFG